MAEVIVGKLLERLRKGYYGSFLESVIQSLGIEPKISELYWRIQLIYADRIVTAEVGGVEADFSIETWRELRRINTFRGEKTILEAIIEETTDGDIFYDVGANIGLYACFVAGAADGVQIYAFEPHPNNARKLRKNMNLNSVSGKVVEAALLDRKGEFTLVIDDEVAGSGQSHIGESTIGRDKVAVSTLTGDQFAIENTNPDIIKIDVEGAETAVLNGFSETLEEGGCRSIYCEIHPKKLKQYNSDVEELYRTFQSTNYKYNKFDDRGNETFLKATLLK